MRYRSSQTVIYYLFLCDQYGTTPNISYPTTVSPSFCVSGLYLLMFNTIRGQNDLNSGCKLCQLIREGELYEINREHCGERTKRRVSRPKRNRTKNRQSKSIGIEDL